MTKGVAIGLLLAGLALAGCQQKSVIGKCVDAQATSLCNMPLEGKPLYKFQNQSES